MFKKLFSFSGKVQKHLQRGARLGFPTANIQIDEGLPEGIYVGLTWIASISYPSLVFIGKPLTFGEIDKKAEVYILDFNKIIYNMIISVQVIKKLRENRKFNNPKELVEQINLDEIQARDYFSKMTKVYDK